MTRAPSPAVDRPRRRSGLLERALPEELVLYDPHGDRAWLLNRTAAAVWDLADGRHHRDEIAAELARGFGIAPGQAAADVERVVGELGADGLLVPAPAGESR